MLQAKTNVQKPYIYTSKKENEKIGRKRGRTRESIPSLQATVLLENRS